MQTRNPYTVLEVAVGASQDELRRAYRRLAREHHPDVNAGSAQSQERFREIAQAYEVLSDPERRRQYDEPARRPGKPAAALDLDWIWLWPFQGFFGRATGGLPARGDDVWATLFLDGSEAFAGAELEIVTASHPAPLRIRIPRGIVDGTLLIVRGAGEPGTAGGPAGDLIIETEVRQATGRAGFSF